MGAIAPIRRAQGATCQGGPETCSPRKNSEDSSTLRCNLVQSGCLKFQMLGFYIPN